MDMQEIQAESKKQIKGKTKTLFLISFIMGLTTLTSCIVLFFLISFILGLISLTSYIVLLFVPAVILILVVVIIPAFSLSTARIYLNVSNGNDIIICDAFSGFNDFWSAFKVSFLITLFTVLRLILFIIPGFIKAYSYSMALYILAENKGKPALECIKESQEMTAGYKLELFDHTFYFYRYEMLCAITLGIAALWYSPFVKTVQANEYKILKHKYHNRQQHNQIV